MTQTDLKMQFHRRVMQVDEAIFRDAIGLIRVERARARLSQTQLARGAKVSRNLVSGIERGDHTVDLWQLKRMLDVAEADLWEFLYDLRMAIEGHQLYAERSE